jgi:hypothetical protein
METFTLLFGIISIFFVLAAYLNRKSKRERHEEVECDERLL